jgi:hypothetical protein
MSSSVRSGRDRRKIGLRVIKVRDNQDHEHGAFVPARECENKRGSCESPRKYTESYIHT